MRMELLYKGIQPGPLFSTRDRTLRRFLAKQKETESHRLMVEVTAATKNFDLMKKSFRNYSNCTWYEDLTGDRDAEMLEYYNTQVKHLRPEFYTNDDGVASVRGLN